MKNNKYKKFNIIRTAIFDAVNIRSIQFIYGMLALVLFASFIGCDNHHHDDINSSNTTYGSGKIVSQTRNVSDCSGITIKNIGDVFITMGDEQSIRIEADNNIINDVITLNENGSLLVGLPDGSYSNVTLRVYVTLKSIGLITLNGAGNIKCSQPIPFSRLSGDQHSLYCVLNGAGSIKLDGEGEYLNCIINGAGNISAKDFTVKNCYAAVNGAGNCTVYVNGELHALVNGVGSIIYYGNPAYVETSLVGLGAIYRGN